MKYLFSAVLMFLIYSNGTSQNLEAQDNKKEPERSNAQVFYEEAGRLTYMDQIKIGEVKNVEVNVHHYKDMITGESKSVVRFESEFISSYSKDTKIGVLDADELDGLSKSLKIIQDEVFKTQPTNYVEVIFRSRTGFQAGCFWSADKNEWRVFLKLEKFDSRSQIFLKKEDLITIMSLVTKAAYEIQNHQ